VSRCAAASGTGVTTAFAALNTVSTVVDVPVVRAR
jgi:hypothetical protein